MDQVDKREMGLWLSELSFGKSSDQSKRSHHTLCTRIAER